MKRLIMLVACFVFIFSACDFTTNKTTKATSKTKTSKAVTPTPPKETGVSITGVVKEISDTMIMVDRTVKGNAETIHCVLHEPVKQINVGDKVRVSYIKEDGKFIAVSVTPVIAKKIIRKTSPLKEIKTLPEEVPPSPE